MTTGPAKVALLLPLSGPQAALGQSLFNAAQMALFDVGVTDVTLLPLDTTGTPAGATQAATQALQSGAQLMIGPVFSAEVSAVTPLAPNSDLHRTRETGMSRRVILSVPITTLRRTRAS